MKYAPYKNEMKPIDSKEYIQYMKDIESKGYVSQIVHAEPKWHTEQTQTKGNVESKEKFGSTKPDKPQFSEYKNSTEYKQPESDWQTDKVDYSGKSYTHRDSMSGINKVNMVMMGPTYFYMHAEPITEYSFRQIQIVGIREAIKEATLLGLLVGMGFDHEQAYVIVDKWKKCTDTSHCL